MECSHTSMLCGLRNPQRTNEGENRDLRELLLDWDIDFAVWQRHSREKPIDSIKNAVIMRHTTKDIKTARSKTMTTIAGAVDHSTTQTVTYLQIGPEFDPTGIGTTLQQARPQASGLQEVRRNSEESHGRGVAGLGSATLTASWSGQTKRSRTASNGGRRDINGLGDDDGWACRHFARLLQEATRHARLGERRPRMAAEIRRRIAVDDLAVDFGRRRCRTDLREVQVLES